MKIRPFFLKFRQISASLFVKPLNRIKLVSFNKWLYLIIKALFCNEGSSLYERTEQATFILPANRTFTANLKENNYDAISTVPVSILKDMLRYHIVKAVVNFNDPALSPKNKPIAYQTENGQIMYLPHTGTYIVLINEGTNKQWYDPYR